MEEKREARNLFEQKSDLPLEGTWPCEFYGMEELTDSWRDKDARMFYFLIRTKKYDVLAGKVGSRRPKSDSFVWHLYRILCGKSLRPSGIITDLSPYKGFKLMVEIVHCYSAKTNSHYCRAVAVYQFKNPLQKR